MLLFSLMPFVSCSKSSANGAGGDSQGANKFFCKINGVNYNPPHVTGLLMSTPNTILLTAATGSNAEQIQLFFPIDIAPGTYTQLNNFMAPVVIQTSYSPPHSEDVADDGLAETGQVIITEHNISTKRIKGTFQYVTKPSINEGKVWNISEGSFDIIYTDL